MFKNGTESGSSLLRDVFIADLDMYVVTTCNSLNPGPSKLRKRKIDRRCKQRGSICKSSQSTYETRPVSKNRSTCIKSSLNVH